MSYQNKYLQVIVLLLVLAVPVFGAMDKIAIILWDEARLAVNALEMYQTGFSPVTTYQLEPDTWNTKPPLLIWLQVLCFKLIGVNEIAFRLPSALAALGTCIMIYLFSLRHLKRPWVGILAVAILLTSEGYTAFHHSARSGDYDALLTFFVTAYVLAFYLFIESGKGKYIFFVFLAASLAVLTKSIAGLIMLPGLFIYALYRKKVIYTLKQPAFYIGLVVFIIIVPGYYLLREHYQPGYWEWVNLNELSGRYLEVGFNTNHYYNNPFFYYETLITRNFSNWYWLLPITIVASVLYKNKTIKEPAIYFSISSLVFLLVISKSTGRNPWYDMPIYPLLSIVVATGIAIAYDMLANWQGWRNKFTMNALPILLIFYLVATPYVTTIYRILYPVRDNWVEGNNAVTDYLKEVLHGHVPLRNFTIFRLKDVEGNLDWYSSVLNMKGYKVDSVVVSRDIMAYIDSVPQTPAEKANSDSLTKVKRNISSNFAPGDTVIAYQELTKHFIEQNYNVNYLYIDQGVVVYALDGAIKNEQ